MLILVQVFIYVTLHFLNKITRYFSSELYPHILSSLIRDFPRFPKGSYE